MRHLLTILLFVFALFLIDRGVATLLRSHFRAATLPAFETFYTRYVPKDAKPQDIVFFGDSRIQHGLDSKMVSEDCNCRAQNIAVSGSTFVSTYYLLRDYLENHNPKAIVLGVHWSRVAMQKTPDYYPLVLEMKPVKDQFEFARESLDLQFMAQSVLRSYEYRKALRRLIKGESTAHQVEAVSEIGDQFMPLQTTMSSTTDLTSQLFTTLHPFDLSEDPVQLRYLEKTITLIQSKNIPVLFVEEPELSEVSGAIAHYGEFMDTLSKEATQFRIPFVRLNRPQNPLLLRRDYYVDVLHVNREGAAVYTKEIEQGIKALPVWAELSI